MKLLELEGEITELGKMGRHDGMALAIGAMTTDQRTVTVLNLDRKEIGKIVQGGGFRNRVRMTIEIVTGEPDSTLPASSTS